MSSIADILAKKSNSEPPEIQAIKDYVRDNFKATVTVSVGPKQIVITSSTAALAGTLRMHSYKIGQLCPPNKRLVFRIG